jgi:hypothetical protein
MEDSEKPEIIDHILQQMEEDGVEPDSYILTKAMSIYFQQKNYEKVIEFEKYFKNKKALLTTLQLWANAHRQLGNMEESWYYSNAAQKMTQDHFYVSSKMRYKNLFLREDEETAHPSQQQHDGVPMEPPL